MSEADNAPKKKKSVALSGVVAGTTAVCTVGHSGNDLHYRGYDILELAEMPLSRKWLTCWFTANCPPSPSLTATSAN